MTEANQTTGECCVACWRHHSPALSCAEVDRLGLRQGAFERWAVLDGDGDPVGPLHERREDGERAVRFMNHYKPGLRQTVYRLGRLRMEEVPHGE